MMNPNDPGRGIWFIGLTWTFTILSLLVVAARFWVRIAVTHILYVEDWLMLLASVSKSKSPNQRDLSQPARALF